MERMKVDLLCPVATSCWREATRRPARSVRYSSSRLGIGLIALAGLVAPIGCGNRAVEQRLARRADSLKWTADTLAWREVHSGDRLRHDVEFVGQDMRHDVQQLQYDAQMLQTYLQYDLRRFGERQEMYRGKVEEIIRGEPEQLGPTLIIMFL
jgi:hypothetical protein